MPSPKIRKCLRMFLDNKRVSFRIRPAATGSEYYECTVGRRIYLVRLADHNPSHAIPWSPDFDIRDWRSFDQFKKDMKKIVRAYRAELLGGDK